MPPTVLSQAVTLPWDPEDLRQASIGPAGRKVVAKAVAAVAPDWSVQLSQDCIDEINLVIRPSYGGDEYGPTFVIYEELDEFIVDQVRWDVCTEIGAYPDLAEATWAMVLHLVPCARALPMPSRLLH